MVFSGYFDSNIKFLKATGFWIYDAKKKELKNYLQHLYNVSWFFYLFVAYLPAEILFLYYCYDDLNVFLRSLRDIGNHISLGYKAFNYFVSRVHILDMLNSLQNGHYSYDDYDDFKPELIVREEKRQALRWTKYFLNFCNAICLSMFLNGLSTFFFMGEGQYIFQNSTKIYQQKQPVNTVSPFGSGTRFKFFVTFIYTMVALQFFAWMIVALDSLFITSMSCVSAHLKILQGAFQTLRPRCLKKLNLNPKLNCLHDSIELQKLTQDEMTRSVKHLQTILRVAEKLESIYSTQTFVQTFISCGEMCFSLYLLSESADQNIGNEITYLIATGFELLMYCWFGDRITEASLQLSFSLYDSDWFSTNLSFRKQIVFTMIRMQKPIYVTIGKITPLTFATFLTIVRGAYSFFTFLKQA